MQELLNSIILVKFTDKAIDQYIEYWSDENNEFLDRMGVNREVFKYPAILKSKIKYMISNNLDISMSPVSYQGTIIGYIQLTDIEKEKSGVMHVSIWNKDHRGKGLGKALYIRGMQHFFKKYSLEEIIFKTPVVNVPANKLKHRLGLHPLSVCQYMNDVLKAPLDAYLYKVNESKLSSIEKYYKGGSYV